MRRLGTTILSTILAGWFSIGDYMPFFAEESSQPKTEATVSIDEKTKEESHKLGELACSLYKDGKYEEAKRLYEQALTINPRNDGALCGLASTYEALKDYKKAEELYKASLKINPEDWICNLNYGVFLCDIKKDFVSSIPYLDKVLRQKPDNKIANSWRDYVRKETGK